MLYKSHSEQAAPMKGSLHSLSPTFQPPIHDGHSSIKSFLKEGLQYPAFKFNNPKFDSIIFSSSMTLHF